MIRRARQGKNPGSTRFRYWNDRRRWMGNLVPAIFWAPLTIGGVVVVYYTQVTLGPGLILLIAGQVLGWLAINFLGLYQNGNMRRALLREFKVLKPSYNGWRAFVGYASGPYSSWLDPHEDVGFLCLTPKTIEFYGDSSIWVVERSEVKAIRFKPNVHSILGLGRWICIDVVHKDEHIVMKLEPRERDMLLANLLLGTSIKHRLENWLKKESAPSSKLEALLKPTDD